MTSEILLENLSLGLQQAADGLSGAMRCSPVPDSSEKTNTLCGIIGKEAQATNLTQVFLSRRSEPVEGPVVAPLCTITSGVLGKTSPPKHNLSAKGPSKTARGGGGWNISHYFRDDEQRENERYGILQILEVSGSFHK